MALQPPILTPTDVDVAVLRDAIRDKYAVVTKDSTVGFCFHTGRALTGIVGYSRNGLTAFPRPSWRRLPGLGTRSASVLSTPAGESSTLGVAPASIA